MCSGPVSTITELGPMIEAIGELPTPEGTVSGGAVNTVFTASGSLITTSCMPLGANVSVNASPSRFEHWSIPHVGATAQAAVCTIAGTLGPGGSRGSSTIAGAIPDPGRSIELLAATLALTTGYPAPARGPCLTDQGATIIRCKGRRRRRRELPRRIVAPVSRMIEQCRLEPSVHLLDLLRREPRLVASREVSAEHPRGDDPHALPARHRPVDPRATEHQQRLHAHARDLLDRAALRLRLAERAPVHASHVHGAWMTLRLHGEHARRSHQHVVHVAVAERHVVHHAPFAVCQLVQQPANLLLSGRAPVAALQERQHVAGDHEDANQESDLRGEEQQAVKP